MQLVVLLWSLFIFQDPDIPTLNLEQANRLAQLPLHCLQTEFPNKLNQTLADESFVKTPQELHPAFYGCFDWHSSVHGHWMLIALLKQFPKLDNADLIRQKIEENISSANILQEVAYFHMPQNGSFERTYGWAWVLKLAEELHTWDDPWARQLEKNLQPLTDLMVEKYLEFLPKLIYPIRVGEHTNIAFGLTFAYDYAYTTQHQALMDVIAQRSKDWFANDTNCPLAWEPSGFDFLSPCFQELDIMRKILPSDQFIPWAKSFLPEIFKQDFYWEPGKVSDRTDGKLVHLDGVNFSRAWVMYGLANQFPERFSHLIDLGDTHVNYSLPSIVDDNYEGTHWLGSFALYALIQRPR